jgi:hypothetical protein
MGSNYPDPGGFCKALTGRYPIPQSTQPIPEGGRRQRRREAEGTKGEGRRKRGWG